jgi:hypothetical protein
VRYQREFFDLQLQFARRAAEIAGLPLERAVLRFTNVYVRLGIGRGFDEAHPVWRAYADGLARAPDAAGWTYEFCRTRPPAEPEGLVATFGCFSYAKESTGRLRLHFENRDPGDVSPLSPQRTEARRAELAALVAHVERTQPYASLIAGVSWLYNLEAYRRLFPESYLASAKVADGRLRNMPLWGQFLDHRGQVKETAARTLLERAARHGDIATLAQCFPLQPLALEAPRSVFRPS